MVRAYRLPQSLAGRTVRAVEELCTSNRVTIERLRRGSALIEVTATTPLETDDVIAIGGRRPAVIESAVLLGAEVDDPELLDVPRVSADLVLTNRKFSRSTLGALSEEVGARGVLPPPIAAWRTRAAVHARNRCRARRRADGHRRRREHRARRRRHRRCGIPDVGDRPDAGRGNHRRWRPHRSSDGHVRPPRAWPERAGGRAARRPHRRVFAVGQSTVWQDP